MSDNILVRGANWIGDAVMTIPALRLLRTLYPGSKVSLLVRPFVAPLFERNPLVDEIILYEDTFRSALGRLRLAFKLRKKGFSRAVLFQNAFDAAFIAFLSGIPERIGYDRDGRGFLLTKPVTYQGDDRKMHHISYYLNLVKSADTAEDKGRSESSAPKDRHATIDATYPWIYLSQEERQAARDRLSVLRRPLLGINPGATYGSAKRWLPERFAEVAGWFVRDTGGSVVCFGSPSESEIAEEITSKVGYMNREALPKVREEVRDPHHILNLSGKTSLRELVSLVSECEVFLSNDSGPLHVAYAVGTPLVAIFGSTDPVLTGPVGKGTRVVKTDISCSPCFERTCRNKDMRCMYTVTSEDVYHAIKEVFPEKKAVFFDRDGTLCEDADYLSRWEDFRAFGDIDCIKALKEEGFILIGITNQSGIQRGRVKESFVQELNRLFIERYGFDDFYYCPHHPDEGCPCRKPEPGMLCSARYEHGVDLRKSYVVGDKEDDMLLARSVGSTGILVKTGKEKQSESASFIAETLKEAVSFVIDNERDGRRI